MLPRRLLLLLACAVLCAARVHAASAPIVFDFEDGLQGWELSSGSAQRVQTQVLGGEWAIFGDGLVGEGSISMYTIDLTEFASISLDYFFVSGDDGDLGFAVGWAIDLRPDSSGFITTLLPFKPEGPGNPRILTIDVSYLGGVPDELTIFWNDSDGIGATVAFIDNITFHPVLESGTLALAALGLFALVIARRRIV